MTGVETDGDVAKGVFVGFGVLVGRPVAVALGCTAEKSFGPDRQPDIRKAIARKIAVSRIDKEWRLRSGFILLEFIPFTHLYKRLISIPLF